MSGKDKRMPSKRTMNLYFKTDNTVRPATAALYILFILTVLLGLSKILIYDLWMKVENARAAYYAAQEHLDEALAELLDYDEVKKEYQRYSATDEERAQIDRMEIVALLDGEVGELAQVRSYAIHGATVQIEIDRVTLAQAAEIVRRLEESPIVRRTTVNTAATTGADRDEALVQASIRVELQKGGTDG